MSINSSIYYDYSYEVFVFTKLIEDYLFRWRSASSLEERILIENEIIAVFERMLETKKDILRVKEGEYPEEDSQLRYYSENRDLYFMNLNKLINLTSKFVDYFNSISIALNSLDSISRRVKQKVSSLKLSSRVDSKFVYGEKFFNFDNLSGDSEGKSLLNVEPTQGVATLPIKSVRKVFFSDIGIEPGSNGAPGNSSKEISTNIYVTNCINSDPNNWFEYERLDTGPLLLSLGAHLSYEQIVNKIHLSFQNVSNKANVEIKDIVFISTEGSKSIKDLLPFGSFQELMKVSPEQMVSGFELFFYPVKAKKIIVSLKCAESYRAEIVGPGNNSLRKRYSVAIKDLHCSRVEFESEGELVSRSIPISRDLFSCQSFIQAIPLDLKLSAIDLSLSFDNGSNWVEQEEIESGASLVQPIGQISNSFKWKLSLNRIDEAFKNFSSFEKKSFNTLPVESITRTAIKNISPFRMSIDEKILDGQVRAFETDLFIVGDIGSGFKNEISSSLSTRRYPLPISLMNKEDDLNVYVHGEKITKTNNSAPTEGEYKLDKETNEIVFHEDFDSRKKIELVLNPETAHLQKFSDSFIFLPSLDFDNSKNKIKILYATKELKRVSEVLPGGKTVVKLRNKNIEEGSFSIKTKEPSSLAQVETPEEVSSSPGNYYVNYSTGELILESPLSPGSARASYSYRELKELSHEDYEVFYENGKPSGILLKKNNDIVYSFEEVLDSGNTKYFDIISLKEVDRNTTSSDLSCFLKNKNIIEGSLKLGGDWQEVEFMDGQNEFIGAIEIKNEKTNNIKANSTENYVSFDLAGKRNWLPEQGIVFSNEEVFFDSVNSLDDVINGSEGDWFINEEGTVYLNVGLGGELPAGIFINYWYKDSNFESGKYFSVDYREGIVYFSEIYNNTTVKYMSSYIKFSYTAVKEIKEVAYNEKTNSIYFPTETLTSNVNKVKVYWNKQTETNFEAYKAYFTPIVSFLGVRFN